MLGHVALTLAPARIPARL